MGEVQRRQATAKQVAATLRACLPPRQPYPRAVFQKAVVSVAILASILFCLFIGRVGISRRFLMISLALYLVISVVNLVSWHPIDNLAGLSWHRLTLVQALKLGCAAMALLGVWKAARSQIEN